MIPHYWSAWQLLIDRVRIIERFGGGGVWNLIQEYDGQEQPYHIAMEQSRAHDRYSKNDLITGQSSVLYCLFLATAIYLSNATGVRYSAIMDIPEPIYRELMHCAFRSGRACEITFQDQAQAYRANNKDHWVLIMALDHPLSIHFMHQTVHLKKFDLTIIPPGPHIQSPFTISRFISCGYPLKWCLRPPFDTIHYVAYRFLFLCRIDAHMNLTG